MKNKSLFFQFSIVLISLIIIISTVTGVILYESILRFSTEEVFKTIEYAQNKNIERSKLFEKLFGTSDKTVEEVELESSSRAVNHYICFIMNDGEYKRAQILANEILQNVAKEWEEEAKIQETGSKRYEKEINGKKIFYIINKTKIDDRILSKLSKKIDDFGYKFTVSFMWDTYKNELTRSLFLRLIWLLAIIILSVALVSIIFFRKISTQLNVLESSVNKISKRQWNEKISKFSNNEIGRIANSIDNMRQQLMEYDEEQKSYLHTISHNLKTPIMVINGYIQSIKEGVYPKGDLDSTIEVIDEETNKLKRMVGNILYINKLNYLSKYNNLIEQTKINPLIENTVEKIKIQRHELKWEVDVEDIKVNGSKEQWQMILDNLLDNQLRYANTVIKIGLTKENEKIVLKIYNDGVHINEENIEKIFKRFEKGEEGDTGLGLSIVKQVITILKGNIIAKNEEKGVSFIISL